MPLYLNPLNLRKWSGKIKTKTTNVKFLMILLNQKMLQTLIMLSSQLVTYSNGIKTLLMRAEGQPVNNIEEINLFLPVTTLKQFAELKTWIENGTHYNKTVSFNF